MSYNENSKKIILLVILISSISSCSLHRNNGFIDAKSYDFFEILYISLDVKDKNIPKTKLYFGKSTEQMILRYIKKLPIKSNKTITGILPSKKYRYIQSYYAKYHVLYSIDNQKNKWAGTLTDIAFSIKYKDRLILEDKSTIYKIVNKKYGSYDHIEKFKLEFDNKVEERDINLYVWYLDNLVITYRSIYDKNDNETSIVLNYFDKEHYQKYPYYDLD